MLRTLGLAIITTVLGLWSVTTQAQQVTLEVAAEVAAGGSFKVSFTTDGSDKDYWFACAVALLRAPKHQ